MKDKGKGLMIYKQQKDDSDDVKLFVEKKDWEEY
jgi:hypothetical protein